MEHGPPHRKTIEHREVPRQSRLFTFSCNQRLPVLAHDGAREIVARALRPAFTNHGWLLTAFVIMPEHLHLLCLPWEDGASGADRLLYAIKRPSSFRLRERMQRAGDPLLRRLVVVERPDELAFRCWQEGPGHDQNIRDPDELGNAIAYIHRNPVKRGLCARPEDWPWSSARQYLDLAPDPRVPTVTRWSWGRGLELEPWSDGPGARICATGGLSPSATTPTPSPAAQPQRDREGPEEEEAKPVESGRSGSTGGQAPSGTTA